MKKVLLSCGLAGMLLSANFSAKAQLALENFNTAGFPAGWVMINVDQKIPSSSFAAGIISGLTANAWMKWPKTAGDTAMLTTSWFNPVGQADRWLITPSFTVNDPNMFLLWEDYTPDVNYPDNMQVLVSTTAGTTVADFNPTPLYDAAAGTTGFAQHGISLAAYNGGGPIRIAFRNNSNDKFLLYLDNVQTTVVSNALDAKVESVSMTAISTTATPVKFTFSNQGNTPITSLTAEYTVDGGTAVSQTFSSLNVATFGTAQLTFTTPAPANVGNHTVEVTITQVNGGTDAVPADNTGSTNYAIATQSVQRNGLIEEFSSSTCGPCASFNSTFDPLVVNNNANNPASNFNLIKYQMDWPAPGTDRANNAHGNTRRAYYGVSGIPDHYTNGAAGGAGNQTEINASKTGMAFMDITGSYVVNANTIDVSATVTPYFTISGGDYSIHVAAVQKNYHLQDGTTTVGQFDFKFVMRRMFPDGNGTPVTSFTAGTPITNNWNATPFVVNAAPAQLSYDFFDNPIASDLVIFVQDNNTGQVLQSKSIPAQWPTDVPSIDNETKVLIYPNPASEYAVIGLDMATATDVTVSITDAMGRVVYNKSQKVDAGRNDLPVATASFASGLYNVTIKTDKGMLTQRLTVAK